MRTIVTCATAALLATLATAGRAGAEEWPKWQGPNGDNIVRQQGLLAKWPDSGPAKVWEQKVGIGFASPIALDGKVYCFYGEPNKETLAVFDADKGTPLWHESYDIGKSPDYPGTCATPTIDGDKIYTYGSTGELTCRELATGKQVWRVNVIKDLNEQMLGSGGGVWGQASSPLIVGDLLYVQGGKGGPIAVAVNKSDGTNKWKSQATGLASYAAVVLADVKGTKQLIVFGGEAVVGMDPAGGKTIWTEPWKTQYDMNASTPIYHDGQLFVTSGNTAPVGRCALFELAPAGPPKKLWESKVTEGGIGSKFQPAILDDGFVYGISEDKRGIIKCIDWKTGKNQWSANEPKLDFGGSLLRLPDNKMIAMAQTGKLYLLEATPKACKIISQFQLFNGDPQVWATPLVYNGKLYAKSKDQLVCRQIK